MHANMQTIKNAIFFIIFIVFSYLSPYKRTYARILHAKVKLFLRFFSPFDAVFATLARL